MIKEEVRRRLVAIMSSDMVGYSKLMQMDEVGTIQRQKAHRRELIDPKIGQSDGRIVKTTGDGLLVEFPSVVEAVRSAVQIQESMFEREKTHPKDSRITYRIGINLGDIVVDGDDILGDGVNIASRIQGLADPGGICISKSVYDQIDGKTDFQFEDAGEHEVKNILHPVRIFRIILGGNASSKLQLEAAEISAPVRRRKAAIAILPIDNISDDSGMEIIADGLIEDILSGLQRFRLVSVISRNSSSRFKGRTANAAEILADLKADYFLEGSIRKTAGFARITVQLIDSHRDEHIWAQRFDRPLDNPFNLQDEISAAVIAALEPVLIDAEIKRGIVPNTELSFKSKLKQAAWHLYRFTEPDNDKAIQLLEEAVDENPNASGRFEALAMGYLWSLTFGWADNASDGIARALAAAQKANELSPDDGYKHAVLGWTYVWAENCGRAKAEIQRAIELNPQSTVSYGVQAWIEGHCGNARVAIEAMDTVMALTQETPFLFQYANGAALGHLALEEWDRAVQFAETATLRRPNSLTGWVVQTVANNARGDLRRAAGAYLTLTELHPRISEHWLRAMMPIQDTVLKERVFKHLRELGLREC